MMLISKYCKDVKQMHTVLRYSENNFMNLKYREFGKLHIIS
jgi:hypothetical protein